MKQDKFNKAFNKFLNINQKLADKYQATVSIGTPGKMIEIAKPNKKDSK